MIPQSAISFILSQIVISSPGVPLFAFLGALFVEDLNLVFPNPPLPPFAIINTWSTSVRSAIISSFNSS